MSAPSRWAWWLNLLFESGFFVGVRFWIAAFAGGFEEVTARGESVEHGTGEPFVPPGGIRQSWAAAVVRLLYLSLPG